MPPEASDYAARTDTLFWTITGTTAAVAVGIFILLAWFSIRFRRGAPAERVRPTTSGKGNSVLEIVWITVPLVVFLGFYVWAARLYLGYGHPPSRSLQVYVVAKQWMWTLEQPSGRREINELHVPRAQAVTLIMTSQDVIHSFYVPAFRVKQDVLPGRYTQLWFTATKPGTFPLFCAEYCGLDHSRMGGVVVVNTAADYAAWLAAHDSGAGLAAQGATVFRRAGCSGCHGENASVHAPDLQGIYGRPVQLSDGSSVLADERYLRDSILLPKAQIVAGYAPIMPSYAGQLSEEEVIALIHYLKSLSEAQ